MSKNSYDPLLLTFSDLEQALENKFSEEIITHRLYIRPYLEEDFDLSTELYGDPTITKYFDHGKPLTKDEVKNFIETKGRKYFSKGHPFGLFSIFRQEDMQFIGHIDLFPTNRSGVLEIGFIFHKDYHSQGFCREAVQALLAYIQKSLLNIYQIKGLMATVHPENIGSRKVLEKFGMSFEKSEPRFGNPRLWYFLPLEHSASFSQA